MRAVAVQDQRGQGRLTSQRSRGLLFLAAGVATAWAIRQDNLRIFENGVGAINLPYLRSQQGSQASRSAHPATLAMVQDRAAAISGRTFVIEAPAMTLTKAELPGRAQRSTPKVLGLTVSCDAGFAARVPEHQPCGACTSCLLRHQSLAAAWLGELIPSGVPVRRGRDRQFNLNAMLWQATRLRACLNDRDPWQRLISEFPELIDVTQLTNEEVVSLYRAYVQEWDSYERAAPTASLARPESRAVAS
ncbi:MAG: 7-cyano-7-deazaguanine synthase [Streptosporangiaceae bacterium]